MVEGRVAVGDMVALEVPEVGMAVVGNLGQDKVVVDMTVEGIVAVGRLHE